MARLAEPRTHRTFSVAVDDAYAGADIGNARRFAALMFGAATPLHVALLVFTPPTVHGAIGLYVGMVNCLFCLGAALALVRAPRAGFRALLALMYGAALWLAVMTWLGGGSASAYDEMFLALIVCVALSHPGSRALPFVVFALALALSPLLYGGIGDRLSDVLVAVVLWSAVAVFCSLVMGEIRRQRIALADRSDRAVDEARRDALTGLENRRSFEEAVGACVAMARAAGRPLSLAFADVDRFKSINDRYGHLAGDAVLAAVAGALSAGSRSGDLVFRWAGDEFAIILDGTDGATASEVCARLEALVARGAADPGGDAVTITAGWAQDDGTMSVDELVALADASLLVRKALGRGDSVPAV